MVRWRGMAVIRFWQMGTGRSWEETDAGPKTMPRPWGRLLAAWTTVTVGEHGWLAHRAHGGLGEAHCSLGRGGRGRGLLRLKGEHQPAGGGCWQRCTWGRT